MKAPTEVVIIGGGTSGWLAALFIGKLVGTDYARVTVIESSRLGTIGVGESSTGLFTSMLLDQRFGLDSSEFFREARATLKLGIVHRDWRWKGFTYRGPIDDPAGLAPALAPGGFPLLQAHAMACHRSVADAHLNGRLMAAGRAPVLGDEDREVLPVFACHFDTHGLARYLARVCAGHCRHIDAKVTGVERHHDGSIAALVLDDCRRIEGQLFVDCSGFARVLIEREMGARWVSWRDHLPLDMAVAFVREHDPERDLPLWTEARALDAGWLWSIPTADRIGCGYVYASALLSAEAARTEVERLLGRSIADPQLIRIDAGRLDRLWIRNCVAIGLAAAFAEPLESTSIHSTLLQLSAIVGELLSVRGGLPDEDRIERYNQRFAGIFDDFRDFIAVHYRTQRNGELWEAMRQRSLPDKAAARLDVWQREFPQLTHFENSSGAVSPVLYLPVLDGLGLISRDLARHSIVGCGLESVARDAWQLSERLYQDVVKVALSHRCALQHFSNSEGRQTWQNNLVKTKLQESNSTCTL